MILPARYGRLWSVAAALVIFIVILVFFRTGTPSETPNAPGLPLDEQQKLQPEEHEPFTPPQPAVPTTPSPTTTTSTPTISNPPSSSTSSSSDRDEPNMPTHAAGDVEDNILTPTRTPAGSTSATSSIPATSSSAPLDDAANLVQPGIQPTSSSAANAPVATLAEGDAVVIHSDGITSSTSSRAIMASSTDVSSSVASPTQANSPEETTHQNIGGLGQPGIQPETSSSQPVATRIADGAAVIAVEPESSSRTTASTSAAPIGTEISKLIVMGRLQHEDTSWVEQELPDWQHAIYHVDLEPNAESPTGLRTKMNKAREAMPYLTYIIDNYPIFPNVVVFMHPHKSDMPQAWHNDAVGHNAVNMLRDLKLETVIERGYVNLRCNNEVGCPDEIMPFRDPPHPERLAEQAYPFVYSHFFNVSFPQMVEEIPVVATQCCAQFAVSSAQLGKRPKEDYELYRTFLEETEYDDETIGRVMEYIWHIIFGRDPVHCENVFDCWCAVYGKCTTREFKEMLNDY